MEVNADLNTEYLAKLKIDDRNILDPFKISHRWMNEDEGVKLWPMLWCPDIFNYLMFFPSWLGSKNLNGYKNSKAYIIIKYHSLVQGGPRKNEFYVFSNSEINVTEKVDQKMESSSFHIPLLSYDP